jgi:hypothetical protein
MLIRLHYVRDTDSSPRSWVPASFRTVRFVVLVPECIRPKHFPMTTTDPKKKRNQKRQNLNYMYYSHTTVGNNQIGYKCHVNLKYTCKCSWRSRAKTGRWRSVTTHSRTTTTSPSSEVVYVIESPHKWGFRLPRSYRRILNETRMCKHTHINI